MARPINIELPHHRAISRKIRFAPDGRSRGGSTAVTDVTCPDCKARRVVALASLRQQLRGNFTGRCRTCQSRITAQTRLQGGGRPLNLEALPAHPAVSTQYRKENRRGWMTAVADVTCPTCGKVRTFPLYTMRQQMAKPHFNGQCRVCGQKVSRAAANETLRKKYAKRGPRTASTGYILINSSLIPEADRAFFEAMRGTASFIAEHRLVMARIIDRPLRRTECIDHIDGNKQNNDPANLRLYRMGTNDPGNMPGHGTYYHEWQLAEARIRELEAKLASLNPPEHLGAA